MDSFGYRLKKIRKENKLRQKDLAGALGLAQTTIANYEQDMRFPDQGKLNKIADYLNVSLDYLLGRKEEKITIIEASLEEKKNPLLAHLSKDYLNALLKEDKDKAKKIIQEAVESGVCVSDIYLYVLEPALKELGRLWSLNNINIAQEHYCSFVTQQIMSKILIKKSSAKKEKAIAVAVGGELHEIGLKMVSDFFEMDGWNVYYLGTNTPTQSIIEAINLTKADILILSATLPSHLDGIENLIRVIRLSKGCEDIKILVGGQAFNENPSLWKEIGADGYAINGKEAVEVGNKLVIS